VSNLDKLNFQQVKAAFSNPGLVYKTVGSGLIDYFGTFTNSSGDNNNPSVSWNAAVYLFELYNSGIRTIPLKQPILRLTRTTNPLYDAPINVSNIDTLLLSQTMIADSVLPSSFAINVIALEDQLIAKSGGFVEQARQDGLILNFAWLKELVSSNKHGSKRIQYITEYQFGLWDQVLYGIPQ
jgi:hypothetical protein